MTASQVLSGDSRVMQTITRYLDTLRQTVDGGELYTLIARTVRRHSRQGPPGPDCLLDLHGQLDAYARDAVSLPSMRIRARLLQQHIAPYLADLKFDGLSERSRTERLTPRPHIAPAAVTPSAPPPTPTPTTPAPSSVTRPDRAEVAVEGILERPGEKEEQAAGARAEKYENLLRSEKDAWQAIYGTVKDYQRLKDAWLKSLDEIAGQRDALEQKLIKTTEHLSKLEAEHERLRSELDNSRSEAAKRPRVASIPRLVSRLANRQGQLSRREGFVRQVQAEIRRIKRSGAPLALGLISVESLDKIIEQHGADAANAALRCYAEEILSNFRAYDIVALYDNDQFAVMFPDTSKEGARRALEKAYKRAVETHVNHAGASIPLPPFAGALITYSPGEDPVMFLGRADQALSSARSSGQRGVIPS